MPKNNAPALHAIRAGKVQKGKKHNKPQPSKAGRGQNQGNGKNKHAYAPKPKIPPPPKREDPAKDSICHECGETVQFEEELALILADLLKRKERSLWSLLVVQSKGKSETEAGHLAYTFAMVQRDAVSYCNFDLTTPSGFRVNPGDLHWTTVKNILKYLRNTKDMFLVYGGDLKRELKVSCYTDADIDDAYEPKFFDGYVFVLNGVLLTGKCQAKHFCYFILAKLSIFGFAAI
ncbi:hypothetical protein Tco_0623148 [Tanacetum coccineum]